jgi:uncharacterized protein YdcH (DUF465 family)
MSEDMRQQVARYKELVAKYEALDEQIDALIEAHEGHSENFSDGVREQYLSLARERDDVQNLMREMEQELFKDGE